MELNKTYNESCLDTMKKMSDDFIKLTITSPVSPLPNAKRKLVLPACFAYADTVYTLEFKIVVDITTL